MAHIKETPLPDVGVIVGRFQVHSLHQGHREILDFVKERHHRVIIALGNPAHGVATEANPLDYIARKQMIEEEYPDFDFFYIKDEKSDEFWSNKLDGLIAGELNPMQSVLLYGSRDSFLPHYHGKYATQELEADFKISGTQIRAEIKRKRPLNSVDWRMAAIYTAARRFPNPYPTVDVAVFNEDLTRIVLIKKPHQTVWGLVGGFAESHLTTYEADARAEVQQETNLSITDPIYVGSKVIDDWRYRGEREKIKTLVFVAKRMFGDVRAGDDVEFAEWFDLEDAEQVISDNHRELLEMVIAKKGVLK